MKQFREEAPRDLKYFESKFEARIEDSREYKQYSRRMPYYMWDGKIPFDAETQVALINVSHLGFSSVADDIGYGIGLVPR
jgi:hypothetical protein